MTLDERQTYVEQLTADFKKAKDENSLDVRVWLDLAVRYERINANMNWYYCIQRAALINEAQKAVEAMLSVVQVAIQCVAVETEPA